MRNIKTVILRKWQDQWEKSISNDGKGRHLKNVKQLIKFWPWSCHKNRSIETAFAKMRIGHCNFKAHSFRFNLVSSPLCDCGRDETLYHIFVQCPIYAVERKELLDSLKEINVLFTVRNLLGGGNQNLRTQFKIVDLVAKYLYKINILYGL